MVHVENRFIDPADDSRTAKYAGDDVHLAVEREVWLAELATLAPGPLKFVLTRTYLAWRPNNSWHGALWTAVRLDEIAEFRLGRGNWSSVVVVCKNGGEWEFRLWGVSGFANLLSEGRARLQERGRKEFPKVDDRSTPMDGFMKSCIFLGSAITLNAVYLPISRSPIPPLLTIALGAALGIFLFLPVVYYLTGTYGPFPQFRPGIERHAQTEALDENRPSTE